MTPNEMKGLSTIVLVLVTISGFMAQADDKSSPQDPAVQAFAQAQTLFEKGEYLEAAAAFERAYQIRPHPLVLGNLGHCYEAAGDYPRAVEAFRKYLEQPSPHDPAFTKNISTRLKKLRSKVGDLRIMCRSMRCSIKVDDAPRGRTPMTLVVRTGVHRVEVTDVDGALKRNYEVNVLGAGESVLDIDLALPPSAGPQNSPSAPPAKADQGRHSSLCAGFWVATAATVLGIGAISVLGALNLSTLDAFRQKGSNDAALQERGQNLNLGTNIAIGLTCATATTALILGVVELKRRPNENEKKRRTALFPLVSIDPAQGAHIGLNVLFR